MRHAVLTGMIAALAALSIARAEEAAARYRLPPAPLPDIIDAPVNPQVAVSPTGRMLLLGRPAGLLTIADLSQPELKLAGLRFNPENRAPSRTPYLKSLSLIDVATGAERGVTGLPPDPHLRGLSWAPDEAHVALTHATTGTLELWIVDVAAGKARRAGDVVLSDVHAPAFRWTPDAQALVCSTRVDAGPAPAPEVVPLGPSVDESTPGKKSPVRTFQDLIHTAHDEDLFAYYANVQLARVPVDDPAARTKIGAPAAIASYEVSPDGKYLLVETVKPPFSHIVPVDLFAQKSEVVGIAGEPVAVIADEPAAEHLSPDRDAVRPGRRDIGWRNDAPATLWWAQAKDDGDPKKDVPLHDALYTLAAPFTGEPQLLAELPLRFAGIDWGTDDLALVIESWWKTRKTRTYRVAPGKVGKLEVVFDRSSEDRYSDPGTPAHRTLPTGQRVMLTGEGGKVLYLSGQGASPEGDRPFLDRFELEGKKLTRLFRSEAPYFERVVTVLDDRASAVLTARESVAEPLNVFRREIGKKEPVALTHFPHPAPLLAQVKKELIRYKRADGVDLTGMLYLPPGFEAKKDAPLPVLMWAYPAEFKSAAAAGQVQDSPYRFVGPSPLRPIMFALRGYAVLDDPTFPIVGEGKTEPNDTYVKQLVMGAQAAVDELVKRGVGDRDRMAIGGHSYGAFTTANLLAHAELFRAGIARSGAYNRTLTPFGFQAEERTFWEAKETYIDMSPFTYADRIRDPLLMIHGADDQNSGTFPIQSERLLHAIKGLGGTARLVLLPREQHGYQARESLMHMAYEMDAWLEKYVKSAGPRAVSKKP